MLLSIEMRPGNDIVKMGKDVHQAIDEFEQTLPDDVHINTITDQSKVVSESVLNFLRELLISVISVIIVVILLMPRRVAEVSALSIPITIFSSVGIFYLFGMELNTVTLAALIVTLGMVVDDSVVIIDNYMEKLGTACRAGTQPSLPHVSSSCRYSLRHAQHLAHLLPVPLYHAW